MSKDSGRKRISFQMEYQYVRKTGPVWSMRCWRADTLTSDLLQVNSHVIYGYGCSQRSVCRHAASSRLTRLRKHRDIHNYHKMPHCAIHNDRLHLPVCLSYVSGHLYKNISPVNIACGNFRHSEIHKRPFFFSSLLLLSNLSMLRVPKSSLNVILMCIYSYWTEWNFSINIQCNYVLGRVSSPFVG